VRDEDLHELLRRLPARRVAIGVRRGERAARGVGVYDVPDTLHVFAHDEEVVDDRVGDRACGAYLVALALFGRREGRAERDEAERGEHARHNLSNLVGVVERDDDGDARLRVLLLLLLGQHANQIVRAVEVAQGEAHRHLVAECGQKVFPELEAEDFFDGRDGLVGCRRLLVRIRGGDRNGVLVLAFVHPRLRVRRVERGCAERVVVDLRPVERGRDEDVGVFGRYLRGVGGDGRAGDDVRQEWDDADRPVRRVLDGEAYAEVAADEVDAERDRAGYARHAAPDVSEHAAHAPNGQLLLRRLRRVSARDADRLALVNDAGGEHGHALDLFRL